MLVRLARAAIAVAAVAVVAMFVIFLLYAFGLVRWATVPPLMLAAGAALAVACLLRTVVPQQHLMRFARDVGHAAAVAELRNVHSMPGRRRARRARQRLQRWGALTATGVLIGVVAGMLPAARTATAPPVARASATQPPLDVSDERVRRVAVAGGTPTASAPSNDDRERSTPRDSSGPPPAADQKPTPGPTASRPTEPPPTGDDQDDGGGQGPISRGEPEATARGETGQQWTRNLCYTIVDRAFVQISCDDDKPTLEIRLPGDPTKRCWLKTRAAWGWTLVRVDCSQMGVRLQISTEPPKPIERGAGDSREPGGDTPASAPEPANGADAPSPTGGN